MKTLTSQIFYKGYTIEPTSNGCPYGGYDYYPTAEGRQDDADLVGEDYKYCGNVGFESSIDNAKDAIMEKIMTELPNHQVIINNRPAYEFAWISEAMRFATYWNAEGFIPAVSL